MNIGVLGIDLMFNGDEENGQNGLSLRFLASGAHYSASGDSHCVSKATLSQTLHRFVDAVIQHIYPMEVSWPNNPNQLRGIANEFLERGMPSVFGCIDGSYIGIIGPKEEDEGDFVNRHGDYSINAMFVCGPKLRFYYVSSRWPGSVHDSRVFRNSSLKQRLEDGWRPIPFGVLLGDSGYTDSEYLVTPCPDPQTREEEAYNRAHKKTRNIIECAIGVLKQRFRCLLDKPLYFEPTVKRKIIRG